MTLSASVTLVPATIRQVLSRPDFEEDSHSAKSPGVMADIANDRMLYKTKWVYK